jgi:hypothetical protein
VPVTGVGEALVAPHTTGHPGASQQAFVEPASGSSVGRAATLGAVAIIIDRVVGFRDAEGGCSFQSPSADGRVGKLESHFRRRCFRFCRRPSRRFRDLPIIMFLELLVRHVIRVRPGPVRALEQTPPAAERAATQMVSHLPDRVVNEPVANGFGFCGSTPGAWTRHSRTSAGHNVTPRSICGNQSVPQAGREVRLCLVVAVFRPNEHSL